MTPNEARTEIANLASQLVRSSLAPVVNTPMISTTGQISRITWPAATRNAGLFTDLPFASIVEYRRYVLGGHYIALMNDGALVQISVDIRGDEVAGHRMCFYPCPVLLPLGFDVTAFDDLDLFLMQELQIQQEAIVAGEDPDVVNLRLRTPLRFDYAPDAASITEPASHLHLLNANARLAVHAPLSVGHFIQFVFKHFYPEAWANTELEAVTRWPLRQMTRSISTSEELGLHINCRHLIAATPA